MSFVWLCKLQQKKGSFWKRQILHITYFSDLEVYLLACLLARVQLFIYLRMITRKSIYGHDGVLMECSAMIMSNGRFCLQSIQPLTETPFLLRCMGYHPSVRSRWQDISQDRFYIFMDRDAVEVHEHAKKNEANSQPYWR